MSLLSFLLAAFAQGVTPDKSITSCDGFLSVHKDLYADATQLHQKMLKLTTQPNAFDQTLYEESLELNRRLAVLQATQEHLKKVGVMNVDCENKVAQQELYWTDKMSSGQGLSSPVQNDRSKAMDTLNACLSECQQSYIHSPDLLANCLQQCTDTTDNTSRE